MRPILPFFLWLTLTSAASPPRPTVVQAGADAPAPASTAGDAAQAAAARPTPPASASAPAPAPRGDADALAPLMATLRPSRGVTATPGGAPRIGYGADGALRYLGAPAGSAFAVPAAPGNADSGPAALAFLRANASSFGITSPGADFMVQKVKERGTRVFVVARETYAGIPLLGAEATVQMDASNAVEAVLSDLIGDLSSLDAGAVSLSPGLPATGAMMAMQALMAARGVPAGGGTVSSPELMLFDPRTLDLTGPIHLVWSAEVDGGTFSGVHAQWLVDAHTGALVQEFTLEHSALNRSTYDANNDTLAAVLRRSEGQGPSGFAEVDATHDLMGSIYAFYQTRNGRDGIDGAGRLIKSTVRVCTGGATPRCPWPNAAWFGGNKDFAFGAGYATDDVVGHEFTHGVTQFESGLVYSNVSGSINESLSDVFGELMDLVNPTGNDASTSRWLIGEDIPGGAIRNMKNPPLYGHPDRVGSPYYYTGMNQDILVHTNSGVNNKLCYLLVDGDTFNGQDVRGLGLEAVERLYYEVQANLLTSTAGWTELYHALTQAALNLGWSDADQTEVYQACVAVEIATAGIDLYVDQASSCPLQLGLSTCFYPTGPYQTVTIGQTRAPAGSTLHVRAGTYVEGPLLTKPLTMRAEGGVVTIHP